MDIDNWLEEGQKELIQLKPFWQALQDETDRGTAIISSCLLDSLLEKLIQASFIRDPRVKLLFKNDHILQSFFAKVNIAYFSGLIPKAFYDDLKLICEIRNKFAHAVIADLKFTDIAITQHINEFTQIPESLREIYTPRLKFALVVSHIAGLLLAWKQLLSEFRLPSLVKLLKLDEKNWNELIITPSQIRSIIEGNQ